MTVVTIHKAKTTLSQLIKRVEAGEVIEIARGSTPVVVLKPVQVGADSHPPVKKRVPGSMSHLAGSIPDSAFFDPLPEDELRLWEGEED